MAFAATLQIVGELVVLRPPSEADVAVLHALMRDPEVSVLTGSVHTSTPSSDDAWTFERLQQIYATWAKASDRHVWAIVETSSGAVVGEVLRTDLDEGWSSWSRPPWQRGRGGSRFRVVRVSTRSTIGPPAT